MSENESQRVDVCVGICFRPHGSFAHKKALSELQVLLLFFIVFQIRFEKQFGVLLLCRLAPGASLGFPEQMQQLITGQKH